MAEHKKLLDSRTCDGDEPYQAHVPGENAIGRQCVENMNCPFEPLDDGSIISSKPAESLCLLLKDVDDGVGGFAIRESVDDWMSKQVGARSLIEFVQCGFEE
jgi:hypothetical protein